MKSIPLSKKLVEEYGQQTYRDRQRTKNSHEDCAWSSVYVAEACGYISEKDMKRFHRAIVKYSKSFHPPRSFI